MTDSIGLAVFVKTPGFSPLKTRLAASIGRTAAEEFYRRSLAAIENCMAELREQGLAHPYWAVAEWDALPDAMWCNHATILQGGGALGRRLARVFNGLSRRHNSVLAIGGDSPQLSVDTLRKAIQHLNGETKPAHVVGRCHDGGFYLVGSNYCIPAQVWTGIEYSTETTADELVASLAPAGPTFELKRLGDVDVHADLAVLVDELRRLGSPTAAQQELLCWVKQLLAG